MCKLQIPEFRLNVYSIKQIYFDSKNGGEGVVTVFINRSTILYFALIDTDELILQCQLFLIDLYVANLNVQTRQ